MADDRRPRPRPGQSVDKSVDLTSKQFDAFKALYSTNVRVPCPSAPVLDNLTKFIESDGGVVPKPKPTERGSVAKDQKGLKQQASTSGRRFLPHQEPIPGKPRREARNVLTRMHKVQGPLALLQKSMNERIRIKVLSRNMSGVRGYCLGYLVAFDKHFNLAMEDVTEVWTRRRRVKAPPLGDAEEVDVPQPRVRVRSSTANTEECERFVSKLLMRGEHVVSIIASDFSSLP